VNKEESHCVRLFGGYKIGNLIFLTSPLSSVTWSLLPIPVAVRSKSSVFGHWLASIAGSNPAKEMNVSVLGVVR
jgi:hypothetical protein